MEKIDDNSRVSFIVSTSAYWFGLRLDIIVSFLTLTTALLAVAFRHQIDPSAAALSVTYCISLTGLFPWAMRQSAEAENFMASAVPRILFSFNQHRIGLLVVSSNSESILFVIVQN